MLTLTAASALAASPAFADLSIRWSTIDGGGFTSSGGTFTLSATIGQHDAAPDRTAGGYDIAPGFWPGPELDACLADCDGSGSLNIDDIDCFVSAFLAGCL
ncbi:MAG: hypothetical protein RIB60_11605 [Phycisphaerales bacterium]